MGSSITVNWFNSKLSNEINLVFVVYFRLVTPITNTFCFFPEPSQYKTPPALFQAHGQSTGDQTSRALQHMLNLEVYKPFKAGEIRIRCLGLQSTCSDKTMERLSECTCSESRTRGTGQKLPRQITHKPSHGSVNTDGLLLLPSPLFYIRLQAFNFPFPLSCSPFPISGRVWWLVALLMCSCVFSL